MTTLFNLDKAVMDIFSGPGTFEERNASIEALYDSFLDLAEINGIKAIANKEIHLDIRKGIGPKRWETIDYIILFPDGSTSGTSYGSKKAALANGYITWSNQINKFFINQD